MAVSNTHTLRDLADAHLTAIRKLLPNDRIGRFVLFIEVVRAMDYWGMHAPTLIADSKKNVQSLDLMYWGWNRTVAELFEPLNQPSAFPLMESTQESRGYAATLMQEFGKVSLLRRLADMSKCCIMEIVKDGDEFQIRMCKDARAQFVDATELTRLKVAEVTCQETSGHSILEGFPSG